MKEYEIIVSYDIEDNKIRNKLFELLKDFGLHPIQKSVFWGRVLPAEERSIIAELADIISHGQDKGFVVRANLSEQKAKFGYESTDFVKKTHVCV